MDELEKELLAMICEVCKIKNPDLDNISPKAPLIGPESPLDIDSLDKFRLSESKKINFVLTDEQFKIIHDNIELFGSTTVGYTKALKMVPERMFWRRSN